MALRFGRWLFSQLEGVFMVGVGVAFCWWRLDLAGGCCFLSWKFEFVSGVLVW